MPDTLPVPEAVREGDNVALGERVTETVLQVVAHALLERHGVAEELGDRELDMVPHAEAQELLHAEGDKLAVEE